MSVWPQAGCAKTAKSKDGKLNTPNSPLTSGTSLSGKSFFKLLRTAGFGVLPELWPANAQTIAHAVDLDEIFTSYRPNSESQHKATEVAADDEALCDGAVTLGLGVVKRRGVEEIFFLFF